MIISNYILLIGVIVIIIQLFIIKETFAVNTSLDEERDRLDIPLKNLTKKYIKDYESINNPSLLSGNPLRTTGGKYKSYTDFITYNDGIISENDGVISENKDIVAYNADDIINKYKINSLQQIKSGNKKIDKLIDNTLKQYIGKIIYSDLSIIKDISLFKKDKEKINVKYKQSNELNFIINIFTNFLNKKTNYNFNVLNVGNVNLDIKIIDDNSLEKIYTVYLYIYEAQVSYVKRLIIKFDLLLYTNKKGKLIIHDIKIPEDKIIKEKILPAYKSSNLSNLNNYHRIKNKFGILQSSFDLLSQEDIDKELKRREKIKILKKEYSCFGVPEFQKITNKLECTNFGGVWDREVKDNNICPYYLSNKNYINNRGGVKNGFCEMPSGLQIVGYRHYKITPESKPICYNCKHDLIGVGSQGHCCKKQQNPLKYIEYHNMKSPDYKFPGDSLDRYNSRHYLYKNNLDYK